MPRRPLFNRRDIVCRTVATPLRQDFPSADYEMIVVVDGSTDGTVAALKSLKPPAATTLGLTGFVD